MGNKIQPTDDIRISEESKGGTDDSELKLVMLDDGKPMVPDTKGYATLKPPLPPAADSTKVNEVDLTQSNLLAAPKNDITLGKSGKLDEKDNEGFEGGDKDQ
jgi:hypothetical protein